MNALSPWKRSNMANAVRHLREVQKRALQVHQEDVFLTDADWKYVDRYTTIGNPYNPKDSEPREVRPTSLYTHPLLSFCSHHIHVSSDAKFHILSPIKMLQDKWKRKCAKRA